MLGKTLSSVLIVESENGEVYFIEDKNKKNKISSKRSNEVKIRVEKKDTADEQNLK